MNIKLLVVIGFAIIALAAGVVTVAKEKSDKLDVYSKAGSSGDILSDIEGIQGQRVTKVGTVICLPHKNSSGPQTLECAIGIVEQGGKNYALSSDSPDLMITMQNGTKVEVTGTLSPPENNTRYNTEGTISVESTKQL